MESFETHPTKCPKCNAVMNMHSSLTGDECPEEGNLTICSKCGSINIFVDKELNLQELDKIELSLLEALDNETYTLLMAAQEAVLKSLNKP